MRFLFVALLWPSLSCFAQMATPDSLSYVLPSGKVLHFETPEAKAKFLATRERAGVPEAFKVAPTPTFAEREVIEAQAKALGEVMDALHWRVLVDPGNSTFRGQEPVVTIRRFKRTLKNVPDPSHPLDNIKRYEFSKTETLPSEAVRIRGLTMKDVAMGSPVTLDVYRITVATEEMYNGIKYTIDKAEAEGFARTLLPVDKTR